MANEFNPWWIAGQHGPSPQEINELRPAKGWAYVREQVYANRGETAPPLPTKRRRHVPMHVYPKLATPEDSTEVLGDILEAMKELNHNFLRMAQSRREAPITQQRTQRPPSTNRLPHADE